MHYYQFNIADYRKDTGHLSTIEHGIYRQLIDWYYLDEEPIPKITQSVMRRLRLNTEDEAKALLNVLSDFFFESDSGYVHRRIEQDIDDYHQRSDKNKTNGKLGGRPKKTQSVINGLSNDNPIESENNPNQEPITNNQEPRTNKKNKSATSAEVDFYDVPEKIIEDFKSHRKLKKAAITQTAINRIKNESEKAGITLADALTLCCSRGWIGFEASWIMREAPNARGSPYHSKSEKTQDWVNKLIGKNQNGNSEIIDIN